MKIIYKVKGNKTMLWREHGKTENLPTPSSYSADIEDTDNDSYTSKKTGALIDNPIAVGMLKLSMAWDLNSEEEAENIIQKTYKNPLVLDVKVPVVNGGFLEGAKFRVSKRKVEMIDTELNTNTSKTRWKCSFNLMQKELTEAQKQAVKNANSQEAIMYYNTSQNYKDKILKDSTQHELNIYIDGNKIEENHIIDFK